MQEYLVKLLGGNAISQLNNKDAGNVTCPGFSLHITSQREKAKVLEDEDSEVSYPDKPQR